MQATSRLAVLALVFAVAAPPGPAAADLSRVMQAVRASDWPAARAQADDAIARDIALWHQARAGDADADTVRDFLARNPDWPGLDLLRRRSEAAIAKAAPEAILAFFADGTPQTGTGALALARAQQAAGEDGAAQIAVVLAWRTLRLNADERAAFLADWADVLAPHHEARLDMALWQGWTVDAGAMLPLVGPGWRRLAEARLGLRNDAAGVDAMIEAVPADLADHPGLAYERFAWRMRRARFDDALALLDERTTAAALGEPWAWASGRRGLARDLMRDGRVVEAYRAAAGHGLVEGSAYADLEWLSGYLALRFLDRADLALEHFTAFRAAVATPISLGRAGYWLGRTHAALGDAPAAAAAYAFGAQYQTSFYGLLAAEAAGVPPDPRLAGDTDLPGWRDAAFTESRVFQAALQLLEVGQDSLGERFLTHLAEGLDRTQIAQLGAMLDDMARPHIAVMLGKRAAQYGLEVTGPYYALHPRVVAADYPVPTELVLAIARRESEFDPVVVSGAGARGFMQLMPGTARDVSGWLGLDYDRDRLLSDPVYNTTLGAEYLARLAEDFDGNVLMMAAGYNAGPARPIQWMQRFGDPRTGRVDVIDWIEFIPFNETRNYVMRVAESLPIYRARLGRDPHPVPFTEELRGSTLRPAAR